MGAEASKAVQHASHIPKPRTPALPTVASRVVESVQQASPEVPADQPPAPPLPPLEEILARNEQLDNMLSKLTSSVKPQHIHILPQQHQSVAGPASTASDTQGRMTSRVLMDLLHQHALAQSTGQEVDLSQYVKRYGANIETIKRVLQHQCLPELVEVPVVPGQESVQSFAEAPAWFRRMHQLQQLEEMEQQQKQKQQQPGS